MVGSDEQSIRLKFLEIVSKCGGTVDLIRETTSFFKEISGCEAIGVRLNKDGDYPYFETRGFSKEFVQAESSLCEKDSAGNIVRDQQFNPVLSCMCGNVIRGRFDASKPFFTEKGSFWSNCTTELLASTTEADRQGRTRNRCNGEGYESVALMPLHIGDERLGLLQINDRKKGAFTPETIRLWENISDFLSMALKKFLIGEQLRESEERYHGLFENMMEGLAYCRMIYDEAGKPVDWVYLEVNGAFHSLTGLKDVIGKKVTECIPGIKDMTPWLFEIYGAVASTGKPAKFEIYLESLKTWFSVSAFSPAKGYFFAVFDNITELKQAQAQLIQSNKMSALGQMASGIAHEFNNPLTGVLNNVQLIKMEAEAKDDFKLEDFKELLGMIEESAVRCKKIARSLLDFSHAAKGEFIPRSLNDILNKTIDIVTMELKLQNITFHREFQVDLPHVRGDAQLLQQVVFGLINNASWAIYKKNKEGGTITIKTWHDPERKAAGLSISDTGIGIKPEDMQKLFTPFFTTKDVGEGTGLGLALFYNIIKSHNGDIKVDSRLNEGTTVTIYLPC